MKSLTALLALVALLILAGCQTAQAPENGEEQGEAVNETSETENLPVDAVEVENNEEVFVNPNYDATLDGDPTKAPAVSKDDEENSSENSPTKVDQSFMSDPNQ